MKERKCCRCKELKTLDQFQKNKSNPLGVGYYCYPCGRIVSKENYHTLKYQKKRKELTEEQKEAQRAYAKAYRERKKKEDPELYKAYLKYHRQKYSRKVKEMEFKLILNKRKNENNNTSSI